MKDGKIVIGLSEFERSFWTEYIEWRKDNFTEDEKRAYLKLRKKQKESD